MYKITFYNLNEEEKDLGTKETIIEALKVMRKTLTDSEEISPYEITMAKSIFESNGRFEIDKNHIGKVIIEQI